MDYGIILMKKWRRIWCCLRCICEDGKGNCVMLCIYGKSCLNGCNKPDFCDCCDTIIGYNEYCSGCKDGYMCYRKKTIENIVIKILCQVVNFFKEYNFKILLHFHFF
ncbi:hypothetical protein EDI_063060 [Entamoeba dispar SAW760]|uniref:Uncharacterized protein n=1 Tax=Entamoeba dispar (strain ATCC PRA-260 / SAW760) TaxID=370354 RepID=B0EPZ6_ENTDS|nr:uncharacterized protein EDI_063060 [Entamoeba dispar SAW760]EDR23408.1 hypothetical protein EDI_063060 [Entamoeba dispar SAW760]|eukprot:EDR23408.1 hypothetical protein EDI_063060 [Entamoeba dispar SAW760]